MPQPHSKDGVTDRVFSFQVKAKAKEIGCDNDYVYMNYASQYLDPLGSYGATNVAKMASISQKYDPAQVSQQLQPGGFKLGAGAPAGAMP